MCGIRTGAFPKRVTSPTQYAFDWTKKKWIGPLQNNAPVCGSHWPREEAEILKHYGRIP
jgi:hypothetical protein